VFSEKEIRRYIQNLLKSALERRDQVRGKKNSDMIGAAVEFIEKNYMADKISLNTVSASVNMSPSYFSAVFSREVGKTFVEYLTQRRMKKAKELLICTSKKTSEVGFEVGYKDPHYFSYIFKKTEGCSPTEYRQRT
jgi:two-component system response regulator YesN